MFRSDSTVTTNAGPGGPTAGPQAEAVRGKGCLANLETLRLDNRSATRITGATQKATYGPKKKTEEPQRELILIENFAERMGDIVEEIRNHAAQCELSCSKMRSSD